MNLRGLSRGQVAGEQRYSHQDGFPATAGGRRQARPQVETAVKLRFPLTIVVTEPYCGPSRSEGFNVTVEHRLLTVREVADAMRVSTMTVYRLVHSGELPAIRVGRSFRIPAAAVDDYLGRQHDVDATS